MLESNELNQIEGQVSQQLLDDVADYCRENAESVLKRGVWMAERMLHQCGIDQSEWTIWRLLTWIDEGFMHWDNNVKTAAELCAAWQLIQEHQAAVEETRTLHITEGCCDACDEQGVLVFSENNGSFCET